MKEYNGSRALQDFFKVVSLSVDKGEVSYISTLEGRRVSQAHPALLSSTMMQKYHLCHADCLLGNAWEAALPWRSPRCEL